MQRPIATEVSPRGAWPVGRQSGTRVAAKFRCCNLCIRPYFSTVLVIGRTQAGEGATAPLTHCTGLYLLLSVSKSISCDLGGAVCSFIGICLSDVSQ